MDIYNEGVYANEKTAQEWIGWIEGTMGDVRDDEIYPYLSAWIAKRHPAHILEIGSGQGASSGKIDLGDAEYVGIEPSAHLRARAKELYPSRKFMGGKAEELPVANSSIDAAYSVFVWLHIRDLDKAAAELARVLKPGAAFSIITANPDTYELWKSWHTNVVIDDKELRGDMARLPGDVMFLHSTDELLTSLSSHGLTVTETIQCGYEDINKTNKTGHGFALIISGHKA